MSGMSSGTKRGDGMNGPQHYREAERLLELASDELLRNDPRHVAWALTAAQVNATLAVAAAIVDTQLVGNTRTLAAWAEVIA